MESKNRLNNHTSKKSFMLNSDVRFETEITCSSFSMNETNEQRGRIVKRDGNIRVTEVETGQNT